MNHSYRIIIKTNRTLWKIFFNFFDHIVEAALNLFPIERPEVFEATLSWRIHGVGGNVAVAAFYGISVRVLEDLCSKMTGKC